MRPASHLLVEEVLALERPARGSSAAPFVFSSPLHRKVATVRFSPFRLSAARSVSFVAAFGSVARDEQRDGIETVVPRQRFSGRWKRSLSFASTSAPLSSERRDRRPVACGGGQHQRRRPGARPRVDRAPAPMAPSRSARSALGREMQRRIPAEASRCAGVRGRRQEPPSRCRHRRARGQCSAVTRRPLRRIHVGALLDQRQAGPRDRGIAASAIDAGPAAPSAAVTLRMRPAVKIEVLRSIWTTFFNALGPHPPAATFAECLAWISHVLGSGMAAGAAD